jgi:hypothetical protein
VAVLDSHASSLAATSHSSRPNKPERFPDLTREYLSLLPGHYRPALPLRERSAEISAAGQHGYDQFPRRALEIPLRDVQGMAAGLDVVHGLAGAGAGRRSARRARLVPRAAPAGRRPCGWPYPGRG